MTGRGELTLPGFVDLQVNGGFGHDFSADPSAIWAVAAQLPRFGVTAFLPTVVSGPTDVTEAAAAVLASPPPGFRGARPLGLHVEGPAISQLRRGAHPPDALIEPSMEWARRLVASGPPAMVTLAPELTGAEAVVRFLTERSVVVAVGHSDATAAQAEAAFGWGVTHATHLFNAMSGTDHRTPGVAGAVLAHASVTAGLIADGVHVAETMLRLAWRAMGPERIALVTDASAAAGMGDGTYRLGSVEIRADAGSVRNAAGTLAGSALTMDAAARVMARATGCTVGDLAAMASTTPARIVGYVADPGDQVVVDHDLRVLATKLAGEVVYRRDAA